MLEQSTRLQPFVWHGSDMFVPRQAPANIIDGSMTSCIGWELGAEMLGDTRPEVVGGGSYL